MKTNLLNLLFLFTMTALMSACEGVGTAKFDEVAAGTGEGFEVDSGTETEGIIDTSLTFGGLASVTDQTDSTVTLNWTPHVEAVEYSVYDALHAIPVLMASVVGQAQSSITLTGLTPNETYKFRVRMRASTGRSDDNTNDVVVVMKSSPDVPNSITLKTPSSTPGLVKNLTVTVGGVKNGDIVKVYSDSSCTTEEASGIATSSAIDLTVTNLAIGSHTFFARAVSPAPHSSASACSFTTSTSVSYELECPGGYLPIAHNTILGTTSDFCVMKYEARALNNDTNTLDADGCGEPGCTTANWASLYDSEFNTSGFRPVSGEDGRPWRRIDQINAKFACSNLGTGYALISNPEWMTIARSVELVGANWSTGTAGSGILNRGYTNTGNTTSAASSLSNCLYNTAANSCSATPGSSDYKRTLITATGSLDEIWDFSGNVWEWVDWNITCTSSGNCKKAYQSGAGNDLSADRSYKEWRLIDMMIGQSGTDQMPPETWASSFILFSGGIPDPVNSLTGANNGLGRYYAGVNTTGYIARRGGGWDGGPSAGVFALALNYGAGSTHIGTGFRCVYRP